MESPSKRQSSIEPELVSDKNWVSAGIQHEVERKQIKRNSDVTEMRILHFMTYLEDNNFYKDHKTALKNFDNYLSSFFDLSESSEKIVFGEIEPHNAIEFLKIIASVTFSRLLKENSLLFS